MPQGMQAGVPGTEDRLALLINLASIDRHARLCPYRVGGGAINKEARNSMDKKIYPYLLAPRCSATSKRTKCRCQAPAEKGKNVCRFHGAKAGAPKGSRNGAYKHGRYTCESVEAKRELSQIIRSHREMLDLLGQ